MKKDISAKKSQNTVSKTDMKRIWEMALKGRLTIGLDLGDRTRRYCILDEAGEVVSEDQLPTSKTGFNSLLEKMPRSRGSAEAPAWRLMSSRTPSEPIV